MFSALKPSIAVVPQGESVLHSARIEPCRFEARGAPLLKLKAYYPDQSQHLMHLTRAHVLIEPHPRSLSTNILIGALAMALGSIDGIAGAVDAAAKVLEGVDTQTNYGEAWISIPYNMISKTEAFRQGLGKLARIYFGGGHEKGLVFFAHSPESGPMSLAKCDEWAAVMRKVIGR